MSIDFIFLTELEFRKLYDERNWSEVPKELRAGLGLQFEEEFELIVKEVRDLLIRFDLVECEDYVIHEAHNWSRFVDVAFENEKYLDPLLIKDVHRLISLHPNSWMICLWGLAYLFVSKRKIFAYDLLEGFDELKILESELIAGENGEDGKGEGGRH